MTRIRSNRRLGAAASGLLGFALLPAAAAFADGYEIVPDPASTETVTSFYGLESTPPSVPESIQGSQLFDYVDTTTHQTVGTFYADESYNSNLYGHPTLELLVTSNVSGDPGTGAGEAPPAGSVFDIVEKGKADQVYSDLASPSGDRVSEIREAPHGHQSIPAGFFDAAKGLADKTVDEHTITLPNGNSISPESGSPETFTAINGYPPSDVAVQGEQVFTVDGPDGSPVGTFDADVTNTQDIAGNYTEALVVTQDLSGTPGTAAGDVLPVGSTLNIFYYPTGGTSLYSDLTSPSGDVLSHTKENATGTVSEHSTTFDASNALTTHDITLPADGDTVTPVTPLEVAGINGLPPSHVDIQGYQQFEIDDSSGNQVGVFDADVTNFAYATGKYGETLLVTDDISGTPGTGAEDVPQPGSTFDVIFNGDKDTIYSDYTSSSGDTYSKYVVNSSGDHLESTKVDFSAGLFHDHFYVPDDLMGSVDSTALTGVDPAAAISLDPSTGLGTLLEAFPHLGAALETFINLF